MGLKITTVDFKNNTIVIIHFHLHYKFGDKKKGKKKNKKEKNIGKIGLDVFKILFYSFEIHFIFVKLQSEKEGFSEEIKQKKKRKKKENENGNESYLGKHL